MAHVRRKFSSRVGKQELLPGIPDHITIRHIAPCIIWKTCNVLQMVSRGWQQAIYNRSVYNSKLFSKSTESFLVLSHRNRESKLVLILYACKDGSSLQLPPAFPFTKVSTYDCICLDGKLYVWVVPCHSHTKIPYSARVEVRVLDLAGDRRWEHLKPLRLPYGFNTACNTYSYGILDGKIYRYLGYIYPVRGVLSEATDDMDFNQSAYSIRREVHRLPRTEVYNPLSDVWSLVTPKPLKNVDKAPEADLERHLACFSEWATKQMERDISKKFLTNGRYESYFSEWRQGQHAIHSKTPSIRDDFRNPMANQVYYKTPGHLGDSYNHIEDIFFCRGKLLKFIGTLFHSDERSRVMQMYYIEKNAWEKWKSFSIDAKIDLQYRELWRICDWAYANNVMWAILMATYSHTKYFVRSPMFLEEESDKSVTLFDTRYFMDEGDSSPTTLRPIYI